MKILITGATGLIGTKLLEQLFISGHDDIRILTRDKKRALEYIAFPVEAYEWNPIEGLIDEGAFEGVDIVVHLAGENISEGRWNPKRKKQILESRTLSSRFIINEIKKLKVPPKKLISSSAIGIYGTAKNSVTFNEESNLDSVTTDFLAHVCKAWEESVFSSQDIPLMKTHCLRTGVVLADNGGALKKMLLPFLMGVGGNLGSGEQPMSWIHIDDLVNQFIFLINNNVEQKIFNGVSPYPLTNKEFTKVFGKIISRPTLFPVPAIVLKALFGEMSEILLRGQRVVPQAFMDEGFKFQYPTIDLALKDLLKFSNNGEIVFKKFLWINRPISAVFDFFSDEKNLEKITPPYLKFKIVKKSTATIKQGTLIDYKLKIHGVPVKWKTEISVFEKNKIFVDKQLSGPYKKWVHQHDFIICKNGTLMKDEVIYKVPMGFIGRIVAGQFVKNDVTSIFKYRNEVINKNFEKPV